MGNEGLSWLDRWRLYRDRLIASPRVQRWALANPLTRPVAHRRTRAMLDLCAGFVYSQVLFTCVRLRLFDILFKKPLTIAALAGFTCVADPSTGWGSLARRWPETRPLSP
jgi:demethylspheroidene O-methyltransferase